LFSIGGTNITGSWTASVLTVEDEEDEEEEEVDKEEKEEEGVEKEREVGSSVTRHSQALLSAAGMCHRLDSTRSLSTPF
jgi:hypothetical protein